jgi:hypothetical protein
MRSHHVHGRRFGRPGGWQQADQPDATDAPAWFAGRLPDGWFTEDPEVIVDRDEITVIGRLAEPERAEGEEGDARGSGRAARFREDTRPERMRIAGEAQARYGRTVSWGVQIGGERIMYTNMAVPVMTRLRQQDRQVLDTLVDAGVARSRSDALAWSVRLVGEHADEWLIKLREKMAEVDDLRAEGPQV